MQANALTEKVIMDESGANKTAMNEINARGETLIIVRQDNRAVKRVAKTMLNFKSFQSAKCVLVGIELMHMIRKGQLVLKGCNEMSFDDQFYALAGQIRPV